MTVAFGLSASVAPASARTASPLEIYARARLAEATAPELSAELYRAALTQAPDDADNVALFAFRVALDEGDVPLALRATDRLERVNKLPLTGRLLRIAVALRDGDMRDASAAANAFAATGDVPALARGLSAWVPMDDTSKLRDNADPVIRENDALAMLYRGAVGGGVAAVKQLIDDVPARSEELSRVAAATLVAKGQQASALSLIADDPAHAALRSAIAAGGARSFAVTTPARGLAWFLSRVSFQAANERAIRAAFSLSRLAVIAAPDFAPARLTLAVQVAARDDVDGAAQIYRALQSDPLAGREASVALLNLLTRAGRLPEATRIAAQFQPVSLSDYLAIAELSRVRADWPAAVKTLRAALALAGTAEEKATILLPLGAVLAQSGDWPAAQQAFEQVLEVQPANAIALNELGYGLVTRNKDIPRAATLLSKAASLRPSDGAIVDSLGWAQFAQHKYALAAATLERAQIMAPRQAEISEHLGDAYWMAGRRIEARYAWEASLALIDAADTPATQRLKSKLENGYN